MSGASQRHTIHRCHHGWSSAHPPVLTVAPGDTVTFAIQDALAGQLHAGSTSADVAALDFSRLLPLTGPIRIDGAEPGDVLQVRILDIRPSGWGWTANIPGFGLLADDFPDPALHLWRYDASGSRPAMFGAWAAVPLRPFPGCLGVAPAQSGVLPAGPPGDFGGNLDIRDLVVGSVIHVPVQVPGALFSIGDTHAAQGDGEVCGTALESAMQLTARFDIVRGTGRRQPWFHVPARDPGRPDPGAAGWDATTGIAPDLMLASRDAVRGMIDLLTARTGMPAIDAYLLCSVAGDLRISEIVNRPNWVVTFHLPRSILA